MKKILIIIIALVVAFIALFYFRTNLNDFISNWQKPELPPEVTIISTDSLVPSDLPDSDPVDSPNPTDSLALAVLLDPIEINFAGINLAVPFSSQAPFGDWSEPYQNACEETAALMVAKYYNQEELTPEIAKQEILKIVNWENETFGYYEDTTSAEIARLLKEYFGFKRVEVKYDITLEDLISQIKAGRPVILPFAGQLLGNPNFTAPGPVYHMLVVKGLTKDGKFITNDNGTRNGHNYVYDADVLFAAIHDAPQGGHSINQAELNKNRTAMIVVYPN